MSATPSKPLVYLKFLNLVQALRDMPTFPVIDPTEERLLHRLANVWDAGKQVTVLEAMQLETDTSPTTIHRRLKSLRKKGVIELTIDEIDNRVKYVSPTAVVAEYFAKLSQCLVTASKDA